MPIGKVRDRVAYGLASKRARTHRYTVVRWVVAVVSTAAVAAIPITGLLRFDLWGGHHVWLGEEVGLVEAAKHFAFPFLAVNILIVIASRFVGRYLCGFACPYGALARLAEWVRWSERKRKSRIAGMGTIFLVCALLAATVFSFWVDWRVFAEGSAAAVSVAGAFLASMTLGLFFGVRKLGLGFCRDWCPSGVYFAVLGPETVTGVEFAHPENCTECKACVAVCPVDLEPTELVKGERRAGSGLYPDGMTNHALCLRCGDCVAACEGTTGRLDVETPLRLGWLHGEPDLEIGSALERKPRASPLSKNETGATGESETRSEPTERVG